MREPADNIGSPTDAISHASGAHEFQPSISPDGTRICYTLSLVAGFSTRPACWSHRSGDPESCSQSSGTGDYNCTWSPDGVLVAYTSGVTTAGRLVVERADGTDGSPAELSQDPGADDFDGNADWAPDARPVCPDSTVITGVNLPVTFQVACTDTGPAYEQSDVLEFNDTNPANGVLAEQFAGDPFTYTPNQGFTGTDSFEVRSFDALGFGTDVGTVTLKVAAPCAGKTPPRWGPPARSAWRHRGRRRDRRAGRERHRQGTGRKRRRLRRSGQGHAEGRRARTSCSARGARTSSRAAGARTLARAAEPRTPRPRARSRNRSELIAVGGGGQCIGGGCTLLTGIGGPQPGVV